jgi:hypothetical protein
MNTGNCFKMTAFSAVAILFISACSNPQPPIGLNDNTPYIRFYARPQTSGPDPLCEMQLQTNFYRFARHATDPVTYPKCTSDEAYQFSVHHAPSSTIILLTDRRNRDDRCPDQHDDSRNNFVFKLRVTKNDLSMDTPLTLSDLTKYVAFTEGGTKWVPVLEVPGLQLIDGYDNGAVDGKLSCAQFTMPTPAAH